MLHVMAIVLKNIFTCLLYWVGLKVCLGFSRASYRKAQTKFMANSIIFFKVDNIVTLYTI